MPPSVGVCLTLRHAPRVMCWNPLYGGAADGSAHAGANKEVVKKTYIIIRALYLKIEKLGKPSVVLLPLLGEMCYGNSELRSLYRDRGCWVAWAVCFGADGLKIKLWETTE